MNRPNEMRTVFVAVDLAREADFVLGPLTVRPSLRLVVRDGREEAIQPRVMQVLVALARAQGAVVSREELVETCWDGIIVGDDSITHSIAKVRQLADCGGVRAFEIDTIPRVGYRLRRREQPVAETPSSREASAVVRAPARPGRWIGWVVGALAAAGGAIAAVDYALNRETEWVVAESHLPFISTPAIERYPALSPDGTMIAYAAGPTINNRHIFLRLLNGGSDPIQLTHDAFDASAPAWSPDTGTIAYLIYQEGHPCRIMEIPVPAGNAHQVGQCRIASRSGLAFDPSGRALFFSDAPAPGAAQRIFRLDLDTGNVLAVTHLADASLSDNGPSISPKGDALLYSRDSWQENQIRLVSLSNGDDRLVADFRDGDASANWSQDGSTIFLSRTRGNDNSLWAYPVRGGAPRRILSTGESLGRLSAGPNGLLAMEMDFPGGQLVAVTPHSDAPPKPIDSEGLKTWCVDYAADGTFIATAWHSETFGIWISGAGGTLRELLGLSDGLACAIRWSPDGTRFAYLRWRPNGFEVPVMTRDGAPVTSVLYSAKDSGRFDWSADGKSLLTSREENSGWRVWRTDLATPDKSVPITTYGWLNPVVHGSMLFAQRPGVAGIWRVDATPHRVTDGPSPAATDVYAIAGDRIIYSDTTDPDHPMFSAQNVHGGPKDRLAPLPRGQTDFVFGVDPKSGAIVYTSGTTDSDIGLVRLAKH